MRARQLLDRSVAMFPPATMKAVYQALDEAWDIVAPTVGTDPQAIDAARVKLAEAILAVTRHDTTDAEQIKRMALQILASPLGRNQP